MHFSGHVYENWDLPDFEALTEEYRDPSASQFSHNMSSDTSSCGVHASVTIDDGSFTNHHTSEGSNGTNFDIQCKLVLLLKTPDRWYA